MSASAWRAIDAVLREDPSRQTWHCAAGPVRDWWGALAEAAPALPAIDAWPRPAQLAALLDPLARSPLEGAIGAPSESVSESEAAARARGRLSPRQALPRPSRPARAAAPGALPGALPPLEAAPPATYARATPRAPAAGREAGAAQAGARVAALWARHDPQHAAAAAVPARGDAASRRASNVVSLPLRRSAMAAARPEQLPAQVPERLPAPVRRWHDAFENAWSTPAGIEALIAAGAAAARYAPHADPIGAAPTMRAAGASADAAAPAAAMPWHVLDRRLRRHAADAADARQPGPRGRPHDARASAAGDDVRAADDGVAQALSRIEARLAAAPAAAAAAAAASMRVPDAAPASPEWLDDDERLAERIHDILRRQARRHGIDTP